MIHNRAVCTLEWTAQECAYPLLPLGPGYKLTGLFFARKKCVNSGLN